MVKHAKVIVVDRISYAADRHDIVSNFNFIDLLFTHKKQVILWLVWLYFSFSCSDLNLY